MVKVLLLWFFLFTIEGEETASQSEIKSDVAALPALEFTEKLEFILVSIHSASESTKLSHYRVLEDLQGFDKMSDQKPPTNTGVSIKNTGNYHWWYDSKSAGVRNTPPTGMSPPYANSFMSTSPPASTFLSTSPSTVTGINPGATSRPRRDSLKNMVHLCDFATPP